MTSLTIADRMVWRGQRQRLEAAEAKFHAKPKVTPEFLMESYETAYQETKKQLLDEWVEDVEEHGDTNIPFIHSGWLDHGHIKRLSEESWQNGYILTCIQRTQFGSKETLVSFVPRAASRA